MKYREVETEKLWDNLRMLTFAEVVTAFGEIESQLEQEKLMREIDRRECKEIIKQRTPGLQTQR